MTDPLRPILIWLLCVVPFLFLWGLFCKWETRWNCNIPVLVLLKICIGVLSCYCLGGWRSVWLYLLKSWLCRSWCLYVFWILGRGQRLLRLTSKAPTCKRTRSHVTSTSNHPMCQYHKIVELEKTPYGLVDAGRQWYIRVVKESWVLHKQSVTELSSSGQIPKVKAHVASSWPTWMISHTHTMISHTHTL